MVIWVVLVVVVVVSITITVTVTKGGAERKGVPPGTMGWPYVGETLQMYSQDPKEFFAEKVRKYGAVFKTHILGCPCVMVASPEAAKMVLQGAELFKPSFPASKERMLGPHAIFFHQGPYHLKLRRLVLRAFSSPAALRPIVPRVDALAQATLASWAHHHPLNTYQAMKHFAFDVALLSILGPDADACRLHLRDCYHVLEQGYNSMPLNLPGTLFRRAMAARAHISRTLAAVIASRRLRRSDPPETDLLASFMAEEEGLAEEQIVDNVIGVIFAARDTTASVLTWVVKYLHDNPGVREAVAEEQRGVQVTWANTRRMMPVTSRVIQETLRCASVLSFTFREAVEDVQYEGFLIPKGWKVLPLFRNIHHNPDLFPDPHTFDPSRFKAGPPKAHTYMPFGTGTHSCPGNDLAKIEMLVLLHHLTTKYTWTVVGPQQGIQYGPFALPRDGLPITLHPIIA